MPFGKTGRIEFNTVQKLTKVITTPVNPKLMEAQASALWGGGENKDYGIVTRQSPAGSAERREMEDKKLRPKYQVYRETLGGRLGPMTRSTDPNDVDSPFVLMPRKDPAAFTAMMVYARYCEPGLAAEIRAWLTKIAEAPPVFGTQGARNFAYRRGYAVRLGDE